MLVGILACVGIACCFLPCIALFFPEVRRLRGKKILLRKREKLKWPNLTIEAMVVLSLFIIDMFRGKLYSDCKNITWFCVAKD